MKTCNALLTLFFAVFFIFCFDTQAHASVSSGTIDSTDKLTKICKDVSCSVFGTVNFKPTITANTPGALPVTITDTGITGHAWGNEIGWINMAPTGAGVMVNPTSGVLSGKAYANVGSWINFSPTTIPSGTQVGVTLVDNGSGSSFYGWAWVSGAYGGWMKFDCAGTGTCVKTDWRALPYRFVCSDGIDNDGDALIDYPTDPGCSSTTDTDESNTSGGGGGSGGGIFGIGVICLSSQQLINGICVDKPQVKPIETNNELYSPNTCAPYIQTYIKLGARNIPEDVKRLETFLNTYEGENLTVNGIYETIDFEAVKRFQQKHSEILSFWNLKKPTGYVYIATLKTINRIYCEQTKKLVCPYFVGYHRLGDQAPEIIKIKKFLNGTQGESLDVLSSKYDSTLFEAVKRFQNKFRSKILLPWGMESASGRWYQSTKKYAEDVIGCFAPVRLDNGVILK